MSPSHPPDPDRYKAIIRRLFEEVWTQAEFKNLADLIPPQLTYHFRGHSFVQVPQDLIPIVKRWKEAFPDLSFELEQVIAVGDLASARLVYRGTHAGEWKGIPPTGRQIEVHEMMFFRFENGRIAEVWEVTDEYAQRQQLLGSQT